VWVKLIDLSELRRRRDGTDVLAEMKKDGLTFHRTNRGTQVIAVTTDDPWLARKWDMSPLADQEGLELAECDIFPKETFLDRFGRIGALNLIILIVVAVLVAQWLLRR
jgi:hypothetical protein